MSNLFINLIKITDISEENLINLKNFIINEKDKFYELCGIAEPSVNKIEMGSTDFTQSFEFIMTTTDLPLNNSIFSELSKNYQCNIQHMFGDYGDLNSGLSHYHNGEIIDSFPKE